MSPISNRRFVEQNHALVSSAIRASVLSYIVKNNTKTLRSEEIEDVCSDAVYKALKSADTFDPTKASVKTWAGKIGVNTLLDALTAKNRWNSTFTSSDEGWESDSAKTYERSTNYSVEDEVIANETASIIDSFVSSSTELDQMIFELNADGFKPQEIASRLGKTVNAVSVKKHRMLEKLQQMLKAA